MKNRKILLVILGILLTLFLLVGVSYAYYMVTASQTNKNRLASSCISISLTNEKNDITLNNAYPITNSEGKKLTPYQFTITNTCNIFISYNVNLEMLEGTDLSTDYIKTMVNSEAPYILSSLDSASTTIDKSTESRTLAQGSLGSGDSVDYALRLWMDENTPLNENTQDKSLISKIVVVAQPSTYKPSEYVTTLHDAILVNEYGVKNVDNAISKIEAKGTPDFSQTAPVITWKESENGTSEKTIVKFSEKSINSDNYTSNLNTNDTLITLYKTKTLDSTTGYYQLSDPVIVDPTKIDYSNNVYYIDNEFISFNANSQKFVSSSQNYESTIYKIISAKKENGTTIQKEKTYESVNYILNCINIGTSELEEDSSDKGIYSSVDDYGKTYYYRGNVSNNVVSFGGFYWRIVRINGDGSIRLLYYGNKIDESDYYNKFVGDSKYNEKYDSKWYAGYMYGSDMSSDESALKNEVDSIIKSRIDSWYSSKIFGKSFEKYIANNGFCNDRTISASDPNAFSSLNRSVPTYKCENIDNDLFTISGSSIGNGALKYAVGLLTMDDLIFGGYTKNTNNNKNYLFNTFAYYTMTPGVYYPSAGTIAVYFSNSTGIVHTSYPYSVKGIRPVINLKADVEISSGIGTVNDPYVIKTN